MSKIFEKSCKINRSSDGNVFYMKVAQKNETNLSTQPVYLSDTSNYLNMEHSPSGHLCDSGPEPGISSRLNPPFTFP